MRWKGISCGALLLGSALASPAGAQAPTRAVAEAPLRILGGRPVVTVLGPEGIELDFLLSTGNTLTIFSETGRSLTGEEPGELTLGGLPVVTEGSRTIPDADLMAGGEVLDGIVAANTLNQYDILLDAPRGKLLLKPIGRSVEWPGVNLSEPVRLRVFHGMILSLNGKLGGRDYGAMLDTGTPEVLVNVAAKEALGLEEEDTSTLQLGSRTFSDVPVRFSELEIFNRWDPDNQGFMIVGAAPAVDCALSISWVHREIRTCVR